METKRAVNGLPDTTGIVSSGEDGAAIDAIDERGYADGVRLARSVVMVRRSNTSKC